MASDSNPEDTWRGGSRAEPQPRGRQMEPGGLRHSKLLLRYRFIQRTCWEGTLAKLVEDMREFQALLPCQLCLSPAKCCYFTFYFFYFFFMRSSCDYSTTFKHRYKTSCCGIGTNKVLEHLTVKRQEGDDRRPSPGWTWLCECVFSTWICPPSHPAWRFHLPLPARPLGGNQSWRHFLAGSFQHTRRPHRPHAVYQYARCHVNHHSPSIPVDVQKPKLLWSLLSRV